MFKFKKHRDKPPFEDDEIIVGVDAPEFTEEEVKALRERAKKLDEVRGYYEKRA